MAIQSSSSVHMDSSIVTKVDVETTIGQAPYSVVKFKGQNEHCPILIFDLTPSQLRRLAAQCLNAANLMDGD